MTRYYHMFEQSGPTPEPPKRTLEPPTLNHPTTNQLANTLALTSTPPEPTTITTALNPHATQQDEPLSATGFENRNPAFTPRQTAPRS